MKITRSFSVETNTTTGEITLRFVDEHGQKQHIEVPGQVADHLLLGLIAVPPNRKSDGKTSQVRKPLIVQSTVGLHYENGCVGLALNLAEQVQVRIAFDRSLVESLRNQVDTLLTKTPPELH